MLPNINAILKMDYMHIIFYIKTLLTYINYLEYLNICQACCLEGFHFATVSFQHLTMMLQFSHPWYYVVYRRFQISL